MFMNHTHTHNDTIQFTEHTHTQVRYYMTLKNFKRKMSLLFIAKKKNDNWSMKKQKSISKWHFVQYILWCLFDRTSLFVYLEFHFQNFQIFVSVQAFEKEFNSKESKQNQFYGLWQSMMIMDIMKMKMFPFRRNWSHHFLETHFDQFFFFFFGMTVFFFPQKHSNFMNEWLNK